MTLDLSLIVPVYKGRDFIGQLIGRIAELKTSLDGACPEITVLECICVSDDATDGSYECLIAMQKQYEWLHVISLSKNSGQHAATASGITYSSGDWIITLDEDMQHDPAFIPRLLEFGLKNKKDIVYARPAESGDERVGRFTAVCGGDIGSGVAADRSV